jgi:light-regulated signal transduction histidine kinase (bacteriophytochrome)
VVSRTGEVLGGLFFGHPSTEIFTEDAEQVAVGIAAQAAIALDNAKLFEQVQRSNEELRRANSDLEQFAYSASHDLQEPLRMVSIYTQLLFRRYREFFDEQGREYLDFTIRGAQRMQALVRDLLAFTQAGAIERSGDEERVPAGEALDQAIKNLEGAILEEQARIERSELPVLMVNRVHLVQLFQNVVGNAIKYRSEDSPVVRVFAERDTGMWTLCVEDNGIGIPPEYREQVFGLFKRLHGAERYSGTGIGLAICHRIVERYGGRMWVEQASNGRGSKFCFSLPGVA